MTDLDPLWSKEIKLSQRKRDPLALSRVPDRMTTELLPGIISTTDVGRNYSFYCWAIYDVLEKNIVKNRVQFRKEFCRRESAYVVASMLHEERKESPHSLQGVQEASKRYALNQGDSINLDFCVSTSNPEGIYGLYYQNAMSNLGLTIRSRWFDDVTPLGKELAKSFEKNISSTDYFQSWVSESDVSIDVLKNYGSVVCPCRLPGMGQERGLLEGIFFSKNLPVFEFDSSRKETLGMILSMIDVCDSNGIDFNDRHFREGILFSQFKQGDIVVEFSNDRFNEIRDSWRFFQLEESIIYSLESLFHVILELIKRSESGETLERITSEMNSYHGGVFENFHVQKSESLLTLLESILSRDSLSFSKEDCEIFSKKHDLRRDIDEINLKFSMDEALSENNLPKVFADAVSCITLSFIRFFPFIDGFDPAYMWYREKSITELSLFSLGHEISRKVESLSLEDFIQYLTNTIILQHDKIALDKLLYGNYTHRFEERGGRYYFKEGIYDRYPTWRNSRVNQELAILADLDIIKRDDERYSLTEIGGRRLMSYGG